MKGPHISTIGVQACTLPNLPGYRGFFIEVTIPSRDSVETGCIQGINVGHNKNEAAIYTTNIHLEGAFMLEYHSAPVPQKRKSYCVLPSSMLFDLIYSCCRSINDRYHSFSGSAMGSQWCWTRCKEPLLSADATWLTVNLADVPQESHGNAILRMLKKKILYLIRIHYMQAAPADQQMSPTSHQPLSEVAPSNITRVQQETQPCATPALPSWLAYDRMVRHLRAQ
jgi:hypothetical protein